MAGSKSGLAGFFFGSFGLRFRMGGRGRLFAMTFFGVAVLGMGILCVSVRAVARRPVPFVMVTGSMFHVETLGLIEGMALATDQDESGEGKGKGKNVRKSHAIPCNPAPRNLQPSTSRL